MSPALGPNINLDDSGLHKCAVANFRDAVYSFLNYLHIYKSSTFSHKLSI